MEVPEGEMLKDTIYTLLEDLEGFDIEVEVEYV